MCLIINSQFWAPPSLCVTKYISLLSLGLSCLGSHCSVKCLHKKLVEHPFLLIRRVISFYFLDAANRSSFIASMDEDTFSI